MFLDAACKARLKSARSILLLAGLLYGFVAGCQKPSQPQEPTLAILDQKEDLVQLWDAAIAVLRKYDFRIARQDQAQGVITTFPLTSMQYFEFWRQDVNDPYSFAQASLSTVQREVTVRFRKDEGAWMAEVEVAVYRQNQPDVQMTSASSAMHALAGVLPTIEGRPGETAKAEWVPNGRDEAMERRLMGRILTEAGIGDWEIPEKPLSD